MINELKCNKSVAGNLLLEHFKYAFSALLQYLRKFMNRLFVNGEFPVSWSMSFLVPLHKKGNVNSPDIYRLIALLETLSKLYISILTAKKKILY